MGNLEFASDNLDEAMDYFRRAITVRINAGDTAASLLANSYLCMSRVHYLRGEYEEAFSLLAQSEALYFLTAGADAHFMAQYDQLRPPFYVLANEDSSVHYAYGNVEYVQKRWTAAKRAYDTSLKIGLASAPVHPITAAAYYSLGCVEFELKNNDNARYKSTA
jgi:tetratricopeptide (TPR) repeat protein